MFSKIKNYITENTGILIRIDDIAENMNWDLMRRSEKLFDKYDIKPVLGIIPINKDEELKEYPENDNFWDQARKWKAKGWEIAMHGSSHVYDQNTKNEDFFNYGGESEFCGHTLEVQTEKIKDGLKKFNDENIDIRTFFAPNHTYDFNTFKALKSCGIKEIIDGYGVMPYEENEIKFIPQLFYKIYALPFGIQSTQIHLNYWEEKDFNNFENFIQNNYKKIITYDQALNKVNNNIFYSFIKIIIINLLKIKRRLKK